MRIYLGVTVRGDRSAVDAARYVARRLEERGHDILTAHLLLDDVEGVEQSRSDREIYLRDMAWVESCDVLVAEASGSSYGVGFEVGYLLGRAPQTGQRAIVMYRRDRHSVISRLITGLTSEQGSVFPYESEADLDGVVNAVEQRGAGA
jgi:2'-deoxynucleoside 5'-phosphate N-hydrolase